MNEILTTILNFITANKGIIIFVTIQLVLVIVATFKSILTVQGSNLTAAIVSSISYTMSAIVTKLITQQSFEIVIIATFFTNFFGVYLAKWLLEKGRKEKLWTVQATVTDKELCKSIEDEFKKRSIQYVLVEAYNNRFLFSVFLKTKAESSLAIEILNDRDVIYSIIENR